MKKTDIGVAAAAMVLAALPGWTRPPAVHAGITSSLSFASSDYYRDQDIKHAFQDVLDRDPSDRELKHFRELMKEEDWSEKDVREYLRDHRDEYRDRDHYSGSSHGGYREDPDRIIKRAYEDILEREPDTAGLRNYRRNMIDEGWTEEDVRKALKNSPEYKEMHTMTRQKAEDIVRRAYQAVLQREPDAGSRGYVDRVMKNHMKQEDIERELRKSAEYRSRH